MRQEIHIAGMVIELLSIDEWTPHRTATVDQQARLCSHPWCGIPAVMVRRDERSTRLRCRRHALACGGRAFIDAMDATTLDVQPMQPTPHAAT